jgi:transposase
MGQGTRRHVTPEFKAQTVKLVTEGGHALSQVAADLGIRASLLRRWRRDHEDLATPAKNNAIAEKIALEEEVRRLRKDNERLRQERDILKNHRGSQFRLRAEKRLALPWMVEGSGRRLFGGV